MGAPVLEGLLGLTRKGANDELNAVPLFTHRHPDAVRGLTGKFQS